MEGTSLPESLFALDPVGAVALLSRSHSLAQLKEFFSKCAAHTSALIVEASKRDAAACASSAIAGEAALLRVEGAQLIEPRGRFDVTVTTSGIAVEGKVQGVSLLRSS